MRVTLLLILCLLTVALWVVLDLSFAFDLICWCLRRMTIFIGFASFSWFCCCSVCVYVGSCARGIEACFKLRFGVVIGFCYCCGCYTLLILICFVEF